MFQIEQAKAELQGVLAELEVEKARGNDLMAGIFRAREALAAETKAHAETAEALSRKRKAVFIATTVAGAARHLRKKQRAFDDPLSLWFTYLQ